MKFKHVIYDLIGWRIDQSQHGFHPSVSVMGGHKSAGPITMHVTIGQSECNYHKLANQS